MRAIGYARVSTDAQAEQDRNSLPLQEAAIRRRCLERGWDLTTVLVDVMSGRKNDRPQYQRMLADARAGAIDVIVVTWLDRFGRNDREITMRVLELQDAGIAVEPTEEAIPDFITLVLTAWKAGQEVQRIADRSSDGMIAAARRGIANGNAPYGYVARWDYLDNGAKTNQRFEIVEDEAKWVRWAFEQYARHNASMRGLSLYLNVHAPKRSGGNWTPREVELLLRRRRYVGDWTYSAAANGRRGAVDVVVPGAIPAIIERALFDAAADRLAIKRTLPAGRTQTSRFLLAGLLRCAHCGGPMHGQWKAGRSPKHAQYYCDHHHRHTGCEFPNTHLMRDVDAAVVAFLEDVAGNVERVSEEIGERSTAASRALLQVRGRLDDLDRRFERNMRMFEAGSIASEDQLAMANRLLASEKRSLEAERDRLLATIAGVRDRQREIAELPATMPSLLDAVHPVQERKAFIQRYITRVEVSQGEPMPRIFPRFFE